MAARKKPTPARRSRVRGELPEIDDLPRVPTITEEISEPVELDKLDDVLSRHTYHLERYTRARPELKRLEKEVRGIRERMKGEIILSLKDPSSAGHKALTAKVPKPTEAVYSAQAEKDPGVDDAQDILAEIRERLDEIERVQTILEHRRTTIRGLIDLYSAEYWGIPDKPRSERGGFRRR